MAHGHRHGGTLRLDAMSGHVIVDDVAADPSAMRAIGSLGEVHLSIEHVAVRVEDGTPAPEAPHLAV